MESEWTLILDDALANSFIAPESSIEEDPQIASEKKKSEDNQVKSKFDPFFFFFCPFSVEEYTRTWEQNEELGLNDIDTGEDNFVGGKNEDEIKGGKVEEENRKP